MSSSSLKGLSPDSCDFSGFWLPDSGALGQRNGCFSGEIKAKRIQRLIGIFQDPVPCRSISGHATAAITNGVIPHKPRSGADPESMPEQNVIGFRHGFRVSAALRPE
ncbi:hypothetical protein [Bosea sp. PAMC 26642]|uniref:hypothetical protein n=1 Tax=Bosea sp. (strain PAMC 26642) TaxID=1792307 RepID=UPI0012E87040|nr:hypothetical protein [Bosea sp. PAMC 26642]